MSRARDLASSGVTSTVLSAKAPLASPDFTGTVDLTGTTVNLDNDQISGDKVSGGTIGAGTFNGTIGSSATFPAGKIIKWNVGTYTASAIENISTSGTDYTNLSVNLTTTSTSNKMVVQLFIPGTYNHGGSGRSLHVGIRYSVSGGGASVFGAKSFVTRYFNSS